MNSSESLRVTANAALTDGLKMNMIIRPPSAITPPIPASVTAGTPATPAAPARAPPDHPARAGGATPAAPPPPAALPDRLEPVREDDARDAHHDEGGDLREQRAEQAGFRDLHQGEQRDLAGDGADQDRLDRGVEPVVDRAELLGHHPVE